MIFVLDVGNTHTVLGVFVNNHLEYKWRIHTDRQKTEDEFAIVIGNLFEFEDISFKDIEGIIISSVVPQIMDALERMSLKYFSIQPKVIGSSEVQTFLKMRYPNPNELGADRIVNAVGAIEEYGSPLIIIDFGTATTYCYVNEKSEYVGGVISPGVNISLEALYSKAAKLPKIELKNPGNVIGSSTVEAMQSGVYFGYIGQVDEVVRRIVEQSNIKPTVIATGGLAPLIAKDSNTIDKVDPSLTLKGLYSIYKKNES